MQESRFHVMYWDVLEGCWRFKIVKETELEEMLNSPLYDVRNYTIV